MTYNDRIKKEKAENLEEAIACYQSALEVYTHEAFPVYWATTLNNLANAYRDRIRGERAENLEKAIASYHNALTIRTKEADPLSCLLTARNLANLHYDEKQWQPATESYNIAIEALENARLEALNPQSRQETLSNAIDVFHRIVQAHLNLNQPEKALEYIERSKARNLVELMTQKNLKPQGVNQATIGPFSTLCDNFCLCKVKCLLGKTFRTILKEETISIDLVSTQKPEEPLLIN